VIPQYYIAVTFLTFTVIAGLTIAIRPDLSRTFLVGGAAFAALYSLTLGVSFLLFPGFDRSWNFAALSGIYIANVPAE
jgi:hypothetical protein